MRRTVLVLAVALMLVLAGCAGGNGGENGDGDDVLDDDATDPSADNVDSERDDSEDQPASGDEASDDDSEDDDDDDDDSDPVETPDGDLEIHHIDVGQADSTLLITPDDKTILVDTGDWRQDGQEVIDYLEAHDIDRIDHLVATHPHADHIGGTLQ